MKIERIVKESFSVIGIEGSTREGKDFISKLWEKANNNFVQIAPLAKKDVKGNLVGIWGLMSDFSLNFEPWEDDFSKGLYLAGVEVDDNAISPEGWVKWVVPSFEYLVVEHGAETTFLSVIEYMKEHDLVLEGAIHDFNSPLNHKGYMYFPIRRL
jgi:predicted transcriptional regulator YdeE